MSVRIASRTRVRALAGSVTLALMSSLVIAVTAAVPAAAAQRPQPQEDPSVPVRLAAEQPAPVDDTPGEQPAAPVWPVADVADAGLAELIRAGGLPLRAEPVPPEGSAAVAPPSRMRFEVLDRAAAEESGVNGLLLRIRRSDGASDTSRVRLSVDYSAFRNAYGADWGARLGLTAMAGTQPKPVGNNITAGVLTADVEVSGQDSTLALAGTPASPAGDFSASPLQSSSVWQAGGSSGDFGWSYPMRMPPGLGGPEPGVELRYSSSSVDGRISGSNTQTSWIGEGFDWQPGFIERRYRSCGDDTGGSAVPKRGDLCWATDNAVLSFGGSTAELLKDPAGFWRLRGDDGTRVKRETTGSSAKNGDNDGEHWVVTTPDGTQYWFGHNKPPGWATNKPETNSVWTVPVYGNHANEPCSTGTQFCTQAWRWNLDFVKDPSGNTVTYWYGKETNVYMRAQATRTEYVRGGYLDHIDYGTRADTAYGTAPMQVKFDTGNRCLATDCTAKTPANWPDTPWDLACTTSTTTSCLIASPTFWTSRRLTTVTSKVRNGTAYKLVESWALRHSFPTPGDATRARLWLAAIGHTGHVGGPVTVPDVTFTGVQKPNRVDANDHSPPMIWRRLAHIGTETGASIDVTYSDADCVVNTRMPSAPETNNLRCFPVRWTPDGYTAPVQDYFHKYVVTVVTETDLALPSDARSPRTITRYDYPDPPAWRYTDDDGIIDAKSKTWSVWRGYSRVQVTEGDPDDQTRAETRYFRGMHGDRQGSNAPPRSVTLPAAGGAPAVADEDAFAGMPREEIVYNGPGTEVSATVYEPWQSEPTATRTVNGSTVYARHTGVAAERERTTLDGGRPVRRTMTRTTFDGYGMPIEEENLGDETVPDDQRCTLTSYARNTTAWLVSYPSRVQEFGVDCVRAKGPGLTEADIISDERTSYDQLSFGTAPTRGLVSRVEELKTWTSAAAGYHVTSAVTHDEYGREKNVTDERGNVTLHDYVPATGGPVTATVVRNALQWETRETLEPAWGLPTETEDANDKVTRRGYDGLGRLSKVWLPGRTTTDTPNMSFAYHVRNTAATVVATATLLPNGASTTKYTLFDAHLRRRQTQERAAGTGGVLITDTHYDSAGRSVKVSGPRVADGAASVTLVQPVPDAQVPTQTVTDYDGAGRVAEETFLVNGARKWSTTTRYGGDRTDVTPPQGGTPTSTVVDAYDRPVQLWQYHGATASGDHDTTAYRYDRKGQKTAVTDPAGNNWTYEYDVRGRQKVTSDPDKGGATMTYNDAGDLLTTTDSRGNTLAYTYDVLGRRTSLRDGSATGPVRAEWAYDTISPTVTLRGQLAKTTRWVNGEAYVEQMLGYDDGYRPTGRSVIIPAGQTGVAGTYNYAYGYHPDGSPASIRLPQIGNLPTETLVPEYNDLGLPTTLRTNLSSTGANTYYVTATSYTRYGEVAVLSRGHESGRWMDTLRQYEIGTRRLSNILTTRETEPALVADQRYGYDAPGNVTKIADVPAAGTADTQCFGYDRMRRLTEAWTPASGDCAAARSVAALGGPAPYWQSFTYDNVGNRRTSVDHGATDSTREYTYPAARAAQPHTLRSVRTTGPGAGTATYT
ncbi:type IV secretion protein Rhs, partial [Actinophytocola sp.]|uniref:RHS repeat domain-containing protein n=1 Tax=Actinophytocola sp. TaxID=1872138 RepID=UPI002D7EC5AE